MSTEETDQQKKQSSTLPPALSTFSSEPIPDREEPALPPPNEPEVPPEEEKKEEPNEKKESPPQPDTEPDPESETSKPDISSGNEREKPPPTEQQPEEPPTLPRALSQETLKVDRSSPLEVTEDVSNQAPPSVPVEDKQQQRKQPSTWPLK
nr:PREDICTED: protein TsetseEP-like [Anolis carolinensis]|eukprot:XP_016852297.1 PREDICTED: protein TsetseEP-like [Anolis carolinensis]